jgi:hypothetical protein
MQARPSPSTRALTHVPVNAHGPISTAERWADSRLSLKTSRSGGFGSGSARCTLCRPQSTHSRRRWPLGCQPPESCRSPSTRPLATSQPVEGSLAPAVEGGAHRPRAEKPGGVAVAVSVSVPASENISVSASGQIAVGAESNHPAVKTKVPSMSLVLRSLSTARWHSVAHARQTHLHRTIVSGSSGARIARRTSEGSDSASCDGNSVAAAGSAAGAAAAGAVAEAAGTWVVDNEAHPGQNGSGRIQCGSQGSTHCVARART